MQKFTEKVHKLALMSEDAYKFSVIFLTTAV